MTEKPTTRPLQAGEASPVHREQQLALEDIVGEFFRIVSFEPNTKPSYDRLYELFIDDGKLIKSSLQPPEITSVSQFIESRQRLVDSGDLTSFRELACNEIVEVFGNVAHRLTTYEKRGTLKGAEFEGRGVISTQFVKTPAGWKISSMAWDDERPGLSLPDRYQNRAR